MTQSALTDDRFESSPEATNMRTDATSSNTGSVNESETVQTGHSPTPPEEDTPTVEDTYEAIPRESLPPVEEHDAVADIDIDGMELETTVDGWNTFPHPENIYAHLAEDMDTDQATFPPEVRDAIDKLTSEPTLGEFLVLDAEAAYDYLETLQKQSDLHLENFHRRQLLVNQLSNGRGYAKGSRLSTYDKKWICEWEVRRRLAIRDFDKWGDELKLTKENKGLPNTETHN